ncbi:MAG: RnfABCDGE type electron transport complex subunit D [Hyphomicrobiaceae bacterium]|nr:RnfABCDGE type electron transport complex subunit D [Hyphomicrobiaceae bacterium]
MRTNPSLPRFYRPGGDPRLYQIATLSVLLAYGLAALSFDQAPAHVALLLSTAMAVEWFGRLIEGRPFDPLSPLITALSLSILLRASAPMYLAVGALLAIASKFLIRVNGKHVFNPANFAIAVLLVCSDCAWVSPGQWGATTAAAFAFASMAGLVLGRARRADTAAAFLLVWAAILLGRAVWLGDPLAIPLKQMQSGAMLLFAFFMITDPRTTPDRRVARLLYAALVACLAAWIQFVLWRPEALIYALFVASPLVPMLDRVMPVADPGRRFQWTRPVLD